jgi:hypothetical protein
MSHIFVSYSRSDEAFARPLVKDLRAVSINVWLDQDNIGPVKPYSRIFIDTRSISILSAA